jgi:LysM repeat protein
MHHFKRGFWLSTCIVMLLTAAGCFQPAGGGLEATNIAQALPTFTPFPTNTELPLPTEAPTDITIQEVPTLALATEVAMLQDPNLDPFWQTATAAYLIDIGQAPPVDVVPLDVATLDPNLALATQMVREATETAAFPLTQTAQAIFGNPTATSPIILQPTWTLAGPIVQGNDCIYEVQPTDRNLFRISLLYGVTYQSIAAASGLVNPNIIHVGDRLVIPGCGTTGQIPPPTSMPTFAPGQTPLPPGGNNGTYVVVPGDTLFALSIAWGTTVQQIAAINQIANVNLIYVGQTLYIPA